MITLIKKLLQLKKEFLSVFAIVLLLGLTELIIFNKDYSLSLFEPHLQEHHYSIKKGELSNFTLKNGKLIALSNDPNLTINNINIPVHYILLNGCQNKLSGPIGQVYYRRVNEEFSEGQSLQYTASLHPSQILLTLPGTIPVTSLRFDLTNIIGDAASCKEFVVNPTLHPTFSGKRMLIYLLVILLAAVYLFRKIIVFQIRRLFESLLKIKAGIGKYNQQNILDRFGINQKINLISQKTHISRPQMKVLIFPVFLFLIVCVLSLLKLHGSSIAMYSSYLGTSGKDPNLIYGNPQGIRSDEWVVSTPWTLAEAQIDFSTNNDIYLAGQSLTITDVPVKTWSAIFTPQNLLFFVLPIEQAFAFKWWLGAFLVIIAVYLFSLQLTKNRILVSALSGVIFWFSPYVQWWLISAARLVETTAYGIFTYLAFIYLVNCIQRKRHLWLSGVIFGYIAICFAITLYPPFQIPFAIFLGLLGCGYCFTNRKEIGKTNFQTLAKIILICLVAIMLVSAVFYLSNKTAIQTIANTEYPGGRRESGGNGLSSGLLQKMISGFYNFQLLDHFQGHPDFYPNESEASSFFLFSFLILPFYFYLLYRSIKDRKRLDYFLLTSLAVVTLFLVWGFIGLYPVIAKLLLLNYVETDRMLLCLGLIDLALVIWYVAVIKIEKTTLYRLVAILWSAGIFVAFLIYGNYLKTNWPLFLDGSFKVFFYAFVISMMVLLLLFQRTKTFLVLLLAFSLATSFPINPIYRGLSPLHNDQITQLINQVKSKDPNAVMAVYNSHILGNYMAANGMRVLNGVYYYPNLELWSKFDPEHKYLYVYNRYGYIYLEPLADQQKVEFKLLGGDSYQIEVSPCNPIFKGIGVNTFLSTTSMSDFSCLSLLEKIDFPNLTLYAYNRIPK